MIKTKEVTRYYYSSNANDTSENIIKERFNYITPDSFNNNIELILHGRYIYNNIHGQRVQEGMMEYGKRVGLWNEYSLEPISYFL